jgi:hypothetical protein
MVLIATRENDDPLASTALRIPLEDQAMGPASAPASIGIVSKRDGAGTLVFGYRTSREASVVDIQIAPGTTFRLVIDLGRWRWTAPVTAQ